MNPPAANGSIIEEKSSTREPTKRATSVPKIAKSPVKKLKNSALVLVNPA
jgi:hypothetical protein